MLVNIVGQLYTDIKVTVASADGSGENYFTILQKYKANLQFFLQLLLVKIMWHFIKKFS